MLFELIQRYRNGELTFDEFVDTAGRSFVHRVPLQYPETDGNEDAVYGVSAMTITAAVRDGLLTKVEAEAIYAAIPATV